MEHQKFFHDFEGLEREVNTLLRDQRVFELEEFGAKKKGLNFRKVSQIAKQSASPKHVRELLYQTIDKFQPKTCLEIGSSLGISSQYLVKALPKEGSLFLLEGNLQPLENALDLCRKVAPLKNIIAVHGLFDETLPKTLKEVSAVDFVYLDGNHTYEATTRYFEMLLPKLSEKAILVFDDIYWSKGMNKAWNEIIQHPKLTFTVDMFQTGFCFMGLASPKQHFLLKYKSLW